MIIIYPAYEYNNWKGNPVYEFDVITETFYKTYDKNVETTFIDNSFEVEENDGW